MKQSNVPTMASAIEESNIVLSEKPWRRTSIGCLVNNWFMITTIVSVISGFIVGFCIQRIGLSESGKTWLAMPGTIYIRLLKLTILPMITANVINVMANLNPKENEKVSGVALGFILIFNLLCSLIGIAYAYIIKPGNWAQSNSTKAASSFGSETGESGSLISCIFKDLLLVVSIPNAFVACDAYGIPKPISRFVLPFAATMKSDASAVFITASCLFIAQQQNIELDAAKVVTVVALSVAYVTALPNIPSASVVAVITVLESIGVNAEAVSLLYAVEWINDRLRAGNVALSHLYCTAFTFHAVEGGLKGAVGLESEI